jgi:succinoglycan biosynthesis transport protein ExoP
LDTSNNRGNFPIKENASENLSPSPGRPEQTIIAFFFNLARKYVWLILACSALGLFVGKLKNLTSERAYTATAEIELTEDNANQFRLEQTAGAYSDFGSAKVDTESEVLRSSPLALQVIRALNLQNERSFSTPPIGRSWDLSQAQDRQTLAAELRSDLKLARVGRTNILQISVTTHESTLSQKICNKLIDAYKERTFRDNYEATKEVSSWLQNQLSELRDSLGSSQDRLVKMQKDIGIVGIDQTQSVLLARLEALNASLTQAQSLRIMQEARVVALSSSSPEVVDTLSNDAVLNQLSLRRSIVTTELAEAKTKYGTSNPRITTLEAELAQIGKALAQEEWVAKQHAAKELDAAVGNETALRSALDKEKNQAYANNSMAVEYTLAKRQYEAERTLYEGLEQRLQEAGIIAGLHSSSVRVIESADLPLSPSSPRTRFNLLAGLVGGLMLAMAILITREALDTKMRTIADVSTELGVPLIGLIPNVTRSDLAIPIFVQYAKTGGSLGWSPLIESFRTIRSSILLSRAGGPPKIMLFTSGKPAEGKSSVTCFEAIILALAGAKVLIIDADLRKPTIHTKFGVANSVGLSTILSSDSEDLESILQTVLEVPGLSLLTSGPTPPMPAELLSSPRMKLIMTSLKDRFDYILIDTPPILTVSDATALLEYTEAVFLVVRFGVATKTSAGHTLDLLDRFGAPLMGVVLNAAEMKSTDYTDYYHSSTYYGHPEG